MYFSYFLYWICLLIQNTLYIFNIGWGSLKLHLYVIDWTFIIIVMSYIHMSSHLIITNHWFIVQFINHTRVQHLSFFHQEFLCRGIVYNWKKKLGTRKTAACTKTKATSLTTLHVNCHRASSIITLKLPVNHKRYWRNKIDPKTASKHEFRLVYHGFDVVNSKILQSLYLLDVVIL